TIELMNDAAEIANVVQLLGDRSRPGPPLDDSLHVLRPKTGKGLAAREGPYGIRTRAAAVRGRCPRPLDEWAERGVSLATRKGHEPRSAARRTAAGAARMANPLRGRLMVGRLTLDQVVKVRVLAPQPDR